MFGLHPYTRCARTPNIIFEPTHDFLVLWEILEHVSDDLLHHRVLAHDNGSFSTEAGSDLSKLQRTDVVGVDEQEFAVVSHSSFELFKVVGLPGRPGGESFGARHFEAGEKY